MTKSRIAKAAILAIVAAFIAACAPEVGSDEWCADMKKKSKGDWSANEAKDYAKHCILK